MISEEVILERGRVEYLVRELARLLDSPDYYQFKIRITDDNIEIIPHAKPVLIKR